MLGQQQGWVTLEGSMFKLQSPQSWMPTQPREIVRIFVSHFEGGAMASETLGEGGGRSVAVAIEMAVVLALLT